MKEKEKKPAYEKPTIRLESTMMFMFDSLKKTFKNLCRQCSSCHGCR